MRFPYIGQTAAAWRESVRFWNTTAAEQTADYPAHRYARPPWHPVVRAVDVEAPPPVVFRWLCQLKVAPYSYDWIDNRGRRSPRTLTPGVEDLAIGQHMIIARIVEFEPDHHITAVSLPGPTAVYGFLALTYQVEAARCGSRLICCLDVTAESRAGRIRLDLLAAGDWVMMRKQLLTLKELAEGRQPAGP
jgi:hypothetical protein